MAVAAFFAGRASVQPAGPERASAIETRAALTEDRVSSPMPNMRERGSEPAQVQPETLGGGFWVHVWSGRDRNSAIERMRELTRDDRAIRIDIVNDGSGQVYGVKVGGEQGYETREAALEVAEELRREGYEEARVVESAASG